MHDVASTRQLRISFLFALVMLIAQFLVGMAVNLFVKIPKQHPGANPPEYFSGVVQSVTWAILHGNIWLEIHAGFGLVLVVAAIGTLVQAIGNGRRGIVVSAVLGFIGVLGAGFNGGSFLNYHQDFSSMLMSAGLAIAVDLVVGLVLRVLQRHQGGEVRRVGDQLCCAVARHERTRGAGQARHQAAGRPNPAPCRSSCTGLAMTWAALRPVASRYRSTILLPTAYPPM